MALERWEIDSSHSGIHFSVRHLMVAKVRGHFTRWSGTILTHPGTPDVASIKVAIDPSSIDTGVPDRDAHLKSADFLDVAAHPEITFEGARLKWAGRQRVRVKGNLTIRGVTRPVVLEGEHAGRTADPWGNERAGLSARTSIDRKDFGLTWNQLLEAGGVMVGDRVVIEIEIEAVKQAASNAA